MTELLDLCYDVLMRILEEIEPEDLAACAQTSWSFNRFLKNNVRLHKAIYLRHYDDPRLHLYTKVEPDWVNELQKLETVKKMLKSSKEDVKLDNFGLVASAIDSLVTNASAQYGSSLNREQIEFPLSPMSPNVQFFVYRSSLYDRAAIYPRKAALTVEERQLSAKLHCLYGLPTSPEGRRALSVHPYARSRVYDLRNYNEANEWGPFRNDCSMRVDWEMVESLMVILGYNSELCCRRFLEKFTPPWTDRPFTGVVREEMFIKPDWPTSLLESPLKIPLNVQDPYGVSGLYSRVVCFLDYNDLFIFNFGSESRIPADQPRDPISTEEATRHIEMRLIVTKVEPSPDSVEVNSRFLNYPITHFTGTSRSVDASWDPNANSKIRGTVRMTPEGEVRWTTVSIFAGEERWCSEGIQPGGPCSSRGVVGTWFDKEHDPHGPAGPTAFWKIFDPRHDEVWEDEDESDSDDEFGNPLLDL